VSPFTKSIAAQACGLAALVLALVPTQAKAMVVTRDDAAILALFSHAQAVMVPVIAPDDQATIYLELLDTLGSGADFAGWLPDTEPDGFYSLSQADSLSSLPPGFAAAADQPSSLPEPATFALLGVALAASLVTVRRNGDAAAARLAAAAANR